MSSQLKKRALGLVRPKPVGGPTGDSPEQLLPEPCSGECSCEAVARVTPGGQQCVHLGVLWPWWSFGLEGLVGVPLLVGFMPWAWETGRPLVANRPWLPLDLVCGQCRVRGRDRGAAPPQACSHLV